MLFQICSCPSFQGEPLVVRETGDRISLECLESGESLAIFRQSYQSSIPRHRKSVCVYKAERNSMSVVKVKSGLVLFFVLISFQFSGFQ